jgi:RNA polymerase sigma factor for flagellar operon FliA
VPGTPTATSAPTVDELVRTHLPLVGHLVRETLSRVPSHVSRDDLVSAGMTALVIAAKNFDPDRGVAFGGFAAVRIRGALRDELRSLDWLSRSTRSKVRQIETAQQQLTAALGRTPTSQELAETLGVGVDEIKSVDDTVHRATVLSLQDQYAGNDDVLRDGDAGPEDLLLHRERIGYLHHAIAALPERLRRVITGYFLEERPMLELAAELGVTESRISQLRAEALVLLRDGLNTYLDPELVDRPDRPGGCVARRVEAYYAAIGTRGTLRSRLDLTDQLGLPVPAGTPARAA